MSQKYIIEETLAKYQRLEHFFLRLPSSAVLGKYQPHLKA